MCNNMSGERMMDLNEAYQDNFQQLVEACMKSGSIDLDLYTEYDVKRGLRDSNGAGVLTGLTEIADVNAYKTEHGRKVPADGDVLHLKKLLICSYSELFRPANSSMILYIY